MVFDTSKTLTKTNIQSQFHSRKPINHVHSNKYLDNTLDPAHSLNSDFETKYKKAVQRSRLLSRLRPYLDINAASKIYGMMIMPIMTYCSQLHASLTATKSKQYCRDSPSEQPTSSTSSICAKTIFIPKWPKIDLFVFDASKI